jgi:2-oxoglutarate ferredoxin oxidoreductase subunit beta
MAVATESKAARPSATNRIGLEKSDYRGRPTTLCQGCGHNSISSQIIAAAYELDLPPERVVKLSGIGCSSKSPAYFLNRSTVSTACGRMPALATGSHGGQLVLAGHRVSGDGDTASIGLVHSFLRRNVPMVYIVRTMGSTA